MRKTLKKIISSVLVAVTLVSVAPLSVFAEGESSIFDHIQYSVINSTVSITRCSRDFAGEIDIPDEIQGYPVKEISDYAFETCSEITKVTIPNSVSSIGVHSFKECTSLKSITLPDGITVIESGTFYGCTNLGNITIPKSVTSIAEEAFYKCTSLKSITLPDGITVIKSGTFYGCTNLENITIPKSVTVIAEEAFYKCTSLQDLTISDKVAHIGESAFSMCTSLISISVSEGNEVYDSRNNCNAIIETESGTLIQGCKNTIIPEDVTCIGESAFINCIGLKSITIPDSVATIESSAFYNCEGLTSLTIPASVEYIQIGAFYDCKNVTSIKVSEANKVYDSRNDCNAIIETVSDSLIQGCNTTVIPDSVTNINCYAFAGFSEIKEIKIPDGVTKIGDFAFSHCTSLADINIPDSVISVGYNILEDTTYHNDLSNWNDDALYIGNHLIKVNNTVTGDYKIKPETKTVASGAFYDCADLTSVTVPESVESVGEDAFLGCSGLESVIIGDGTKMIGNSAFENCDNLKSVALGNSVTAIGYGTFSGCESLTKIVIPDSVKLIDTASFIECANLNEVVIGNGVTEIGEGAFYGCTALTSITLPDGLKRIDDLAFSDCTGLAKLTIPGSVTSIGEGAFSRCVGLTDLVLHDGLTRIGAQAFGDCSNLKSITIPDTVTRIGAQAFYDCSNLKSITIPENVERIESFAFDGCTSLKEINIADGVTMIEGNAFNETEYFNDPSNWDNDVLYIGKHLIVAKDTVGGEYDIKPGTKTVASEAFGYCENLTNISIPDTVEYIGNYAFYGTGYYSNLSNWDNDVLYIGKHLIVAKDTVGGEYDIKPGTKTVASEAFDGCENLTNISIPDSVTNINDRAFYYCTELTDITIPDSVTSIGDYAFMSCYGLKSVSIPGSVTTIGDFTFYDCTGLKSITFSDNLKTIGNYAFACCKSLSDVTLPKNLKVIGDYAFVKCGSLMKVEIPDGVTEIGVAAFAGCNKLICLTIPKSVTNLGVRAFGYHIVEESVGKSDNSFIFCYENSLAEHYAVCNGINYKILIEEENVPDYLKYSIDDGEVTVVGCDKKVYGEMTIPSKIEGYPVTRIESRAFENCTGLNAIKIPESVKSIGYNAFLHTGYYNNLSNWENDILYIDNFLIEAKPSLKGACVIRPETKTIADNAFYGCEKLKTVCLLSADTIIGQNAFPKNDGLQILARKDSSVFNTLNSQGYNTIPYSFTVNKEDKDKPMLAFDGKVVLSENMWSCICNLLKDTDVQYIYFEKFDFGDIMPEYIIEDFDEGSFVYEKAVLSILKDGETIRLGSIEEKSSFQLFFEKLVEAFTFVLDSVISGAKSLWASIKKWFR